MSWHARQMLQMGVALGQVPGKRIVSRNNAPVDGTGKFVLYWMIAYRRTGWNFALQRAADWARLPVYGMVRYMSSESTLKKPHAREYVRRYSP